MAGASVELFISFILINPDGREKFIVYRLPASAELSCQRKQRKKFGLLKDISKCVLHPQNLTLEGGQGMEISYGPLPHKKITQSALKMVSGAKTPTLCPGSGVRGRDTRPMPWK